MDDTEVEDSFTFIQEPNVKYSVEEKLSHAREKMLNRVFMGYYGDRRYVPQLNDYRDVVVLSSAESDLKSDLEAIVKELERIHNVKWIGITCDKVKSSKPGFSLWVKLKNLHFGSFLFLLKRINYENGEIILELKSLRAIKQQDYEDAVKDAIPEPENPDNSKAIVNSEYEFDFDPAQKIAMLLAILNQKVQQIKPHLTLNNLFIVTKIIFSLVFVLTATSLKFVFHLGDYSLKVLRELRLILQTLTPIILTIIDLLSKIVGGIFFLIAMIWKDFAATPRVPREFHPNQEKSYYSHQPPRQLMPPSASSNYFRGPQRRGY